jgi:hypothetical protein
VIFDDQENPGTPASFHFSPRPPQSGIIPFPAEAQSTRVGGPEFPVPFDFGWLYLNLNTSISRVTEPADTAAAQAWVMVRMSAQGRFSVGLDAIQVDNASRALHHNPGHPEAGKRAAPAAAFWVIMVPVHVSPGLLTGPAAIVRLRRPQLGTAEPPVRAR